MSSRTLISTWPGGCPIRHGSPDSRLTSGCGWSPDNGSRKSTAATSAPPCATPAARCRSTEALPQASSASLAAQLFGRLTTPSQAAVRAERQLQLQAVLNGMEPMDREILALRHFEELSNGEAAEVLGLSKTAANNRYIRALGRLRDLLEDVPGFFLTSRE